MVIESDESMVLPASLHREQFARSQRLHYGSFIHAQKGHQGQFWCYVELGKRFPRS